MGPHRPRRRLRRVRRDPEPGRRPHRRRLRDRRLTDDRQRSTPTFGTDGVVIADINASGDSARNIRTARRRHDPRHRLQPRRRRRRQPGAHPDDRRTACSTRRSATAASPTTSSSPASPSRTRSSRRATTTSSPATAAAPTRGEGRPRRLPLPRRRQLGQDLRHRWRLTRLDLAGEDDRARNLTILPDGNILVVGSGKLDADNVDAMVVHARPRRRARSRRSATTATSSSTSADPATPSSASAVTADGSAVLLAGFKGADPDGDRERRRRARPHRPLARTIHRTATTRGDGLGGSLALTGVLEPAAWRTHEGSRSGCWQTKGRARLEGRPRARGKRVRLGA